MSKVLITGASGFVGKYLLKYLHSKSIDIVLLSRVKIKGHKTFVCEYEKDAVPKSCFSNVNTIIHLAAYSKDVGIFNEQLKEKYLNFNHYKTLELADTSINLKIKNFIFVSSSKAMKYSNIDDINSVTDYGSLKNFTEHKLIKKFENTGLNLKILRFPIMYGPNMQNNLHLMRIAIRYGLFPNFPEINNKKQLIHIDDVVKSIYHMIANSQKKTIYYFTDGEVYTTRKIQNIFCEIENKNKPIFRFPLKSLEKVASFSNYFQIILKKLTEEEFYQDSDRIIELNKNKTLYDIDETTF